MASEKFRQPGQVGERNTVCDGVLDREKIDQLQAQSALHLKANNINAVDFSAPELTHLLRALYKLRYLHEDHVFLVKGQSVNSIKTAFKGACLRAKVDGFRFHDFRHTAVTNMRRAGIDHLTIMRITGHKTLEVFKRYNSFLDSDLKEAASRFNTYLTLAHSSQTSDLSKSLINQA